MIPSNLIPSWPPLRHKTLTETSIQQSPPSTPTPASKRAPLSSLAHYSGLNTPLSEPPPKKARKTYRNGYETKPKTPSYSPFKLNNPGRPRQKPFAFYGYKTLSSLKPRTADEWTELAVSTGLLELGQRVRDFQVEAANHVIARKGDLCVIAPTGSGKSHLWMLPLLAQEFGIAVVIVPFTSLGYQGEKRHADLKSPIKCTFLHSGSYTTKTLEDIAVGGAKHVVYTCVEMLESPAIAQVIHSTSFQAQLSGIYIDEGHVLHESHTWRPAYGRLHLLRAIIGTNAPMVAISATLPKSYRTSLEYFAGLQSDYHLVNLGNFRPELSVIVSNMQYAASSFNDLAFVLPWNATTRSIKQTIIYSDDLELLTAMFWWFYARLGSMSLPTGLVDILHAGLSEDHQKICTDDFIAGKSKILLGSDKIGAGMDFPNVELVVQYRCRGLTLVKWEQRRGRGATTLCYNCAQYTVLTHFHVCTVYGHYPVHNVTHTLCTGGVFYTPRRIPMPLVPHFWLIAHGPPSSPAKQGASAFSLSGSYPKWVPGSAGCPFFSPVTVPLFPPSSSIIDHSGRHVNLESRPSSLLLCSPLMQ